MICFLEPPLHKPNLRALKLLRTLVKPDFHFSEKRTEFNFTQALDYLHFNKVVHGDLKPENVLMSARGAVTLSDFGCSKVIISGNEYLERCNGTPAFLAPEMMRPQSRYRSVPFLLPSDEPFLLPCMFMSLGNAATNVMTDRKEGGGGGACNCIDLKT